MAIVEQDILNLEEAIKEIIVGKRTVSFTSIDSSYRYQELDLKQAREILADWKMLVKTSDTPRRSRVIRTRFSKGL